MGVDDSLPDDMTTLKAMLRAERTARLAAEADAQAQTLLIEKLKLTIRKLRHEQFGQSSERGALLDQLELRLADLEENAAQAETAAQMAAVDKITVPSFERRKPARRPLPEHLPRERLVYPAPVTCPCCGDNRLRKLGEDERITPFVAHLLAHLASDATPVKVDGDVEYLINRNSHGWVVTLFNDNGVFKPQQGLAQGVVETKLLRTFHEPEIDMVIAFATRLDRHVNLGIIHEIAGVHVKEAGQQQTGGAGQVRPRAALDLREVRLADFPFQFVADALGDFALGHLPAQAAGCPFEESELRNLVSQAHCN